MELMESRRPGEAWARHLGARAGVFGEPARGGEIVQVRGSIPPTSSPLQPWRHAPGRAAADNADKLTDDGRQRLVRHGHLPERQIVTGIGPVAVRCPRVRDRAGEGSERIRFSSAIFPPYARRSKSLEVLIPILYLKGISTGEFDEALVALLGKDAGGLSASTIGRLKDAWSEEHARWSRRDLSAKRYVRASLLSGN
jgi:Transposase, Mutator family